MIFSQHSTYFSVSETPRLTCFLQATRSSCSLHVSFKLSPVHSFTSSNHRRPILLAFLVIFPNYFIRQDGVCLDGLCPVRSHHMSKPSDLQTISSSVSYFTIMFCNSHTCVSQRCNTHATVFCSNCFQMSVCVFSDNYRGSTIRRHTAV